MLKTDLYGLSVLVLPKESDDLGLLTLPLPLPTPLLLLLVMHHRLVVTKAAGALRDNRVQFYIVPGGGRWKSRGENYSDLTAGRCGENIWLTFT